MKYDMDMIRDTVRRNPEVEIIYFWGGAGIRLL